MADRFAYWPFWIPELIIGVPLLLFLLYRQMRANTLANLCWHGAIFLFAFAYVSRFLNENYLGYILALLALGYYLGGEQAEPLTETMPGKNLSA